MVEDINGRGVNIDEDSSTFDEIPFLKSQSFPWLVPLSSKGVSVSSHDCDPGRTKYYVVQIGRQGVIYTT